MAAAYSARQLGVPATIIVPSVTPDPTVQRMKDEGATVVIHGKVSQSFFFTDYSNFKIRDGLSDMQNGNKAPADM